MKVCWCNRLCNGKDLVQAEILPQQPFEQKKQG